MSRRQQQNELRDDLKSLQRQDLEDVVKVQTYVVGVTMGHNDFQHPNSPRIHRGSRYLPNQTEIDFAQQSRSTLYTNFFRFMIVGALTPYITLRLFSMMHRSVIPTQRYMFWASIGGGFGGMYGLTMGRMQSARDYLRLEGSPLATEARYQLWKRNPSHAFLRGFENETIDWKHNNDSYDDDDDDYDEYKDNKYREREIERDRSRNRYTEREREREDKYEYDTDDLKRRKRARFYQGKSRVNNNHLDGGYEDMSEFFESSSNGNSPDHDAGEFFETDNKQKWE